MDFAVLKRLFQDRSLRYIVRKDAFITWILISGRIQMDQNISKIILSFIDHAECSDWDQKHDDLLKTITTDQFTFDHAAWDHWQNLRFFDRIELAAYHQSQGDKMIPGKRKLEEIYDYLL